MVASESAWLAGFEGLTRKKALMLGSSSLASSSSAMSHPSPSVEETFTDTKP